MAQLKSYLKGLFWSDKDNIYTARLNNVGDTILVHDTNDSLTLERMLTQDHNGFKDGQKMRDLFNAFYYNNYTYNNVTNEFVDDSVNGPYSHYLNRTLEDYTEETEQTPTVTEDETVVTITPTETMLVKVSFGDDTTGNDITVKLYKSTTLVRAFNVKADKDNDFTYFINPTDTDIDSIEIIWTDNENNNTVITLTEPSSNEGE